MLDVHLGISFYVAPSSAAFLRSEKMCGLFAGRGPGWLKISGSSYKFRSECNSDLKEGFTTHYNKDKQD